MPIQQAGTGVPKSSSATHYLRDFINETDPPGTDPGLVTKNKAARARAATRLAEMESRATQAASAQQAASNGRASAQQAAAVARQESAATRQARELATGISDAASSIGDGAKNAADKANDWLASLPTPGSIAMILAAIFFFIWAVVPVGKNGETRLQLLFLTLKGETSIEGAPSNTLNGAKPTQPSSTTAFQPASGVPTNLPTPTTLTVANNGHQPVINPNTGFTPDFGSF